MKEKPFFIPRIPLNEEGLCAHATIESAARAFKIKNIKQDDLHIHVNDPDWGTEPEELIEMARDVIDDTHILAKDKWRLNEVKSLLESSRAVLIIDITDCLDRVDKTSGEKVAGVDGHYVILSRIIYINNEPYALLIDPSKDEIVVEGNYDVITTNTENEYFLPFRILDKLWVDDKKDMSLNDHWGLVLLHPKDDPAILEEFRK